MLVPGWRMINSKKDKHRETVFIRERNSNVFIGKAYGHDGQNVNLNAEIMCNAPEMLHIIAALVGDIEKTCEVIAKRSPRGENYREAMALLRKFGVK